MDRTSTKFQGLKLHIHLRKLLISPKKVRSEDVGEEEIQDDMVPHGDDERNSEEEDDESFIEVDMNEGGHEVEMRNDILGNRVSEDNEIVQWCNAKRSV